MEPRQIDWDIRFYHKTCGVYCFIHRETSRCYVGQSVTCGKRIIGHLSQARKGWSGTFNDAIRKYGIDAFDFELIEECPRDKTLLAERESFWIKFYDSASENGFNILRNPAESNLGFHIAESSKRRMRAAKIGRPLSPEHRNKISLSNLGRIKSTDERKKLSLGRIGKRQSDEAKQKIREFHLGKPLSELTKSRMRESAKHRPPISEETRQKLIAARRLFRHTEATKQRLRELKTGLVKSPETIEKLRLAGLGRKDSVEVKERKRLAALNRKPSATRNASLKAAWIRRRQKMQLDNGIQNGNLPETAHAQTPTQNGLRETAERLAVG